MRSDLATIQRLTMTAFGLTTAALSAWWLVTTPTTSRQRTIAELSVQQGMQPGSTKSAKNVSLHDVRAQSIAENTLRWAPNDSAAWLALAFTGERNDWVDRKATAALKMSYYTGFNIPSIIEPRFALLARLDTERDPELAELLKRQVTLIASRAPRLKPAIVAAYSEATPVNRELIKSQLAELGVDLHDSAPVPSTREKSAQ